MRRRYSSNKAASGGLGICEVLTLIFVVLKLVHVINWPWIWVLSPSWIPVVVLLLVVIVLAVIKQIEDDNYK